MVDFRMASEMILQKEEAASVKLTCKCNIRLKDNISVKHSQVLKI